MFIFPVICEKHEHEISISEEIFKKRDDPDLEMIKHMKCAYLSDFSDFDYQYPIGALWFSCTHRRFQIFFEDYSRGALCVLN
jgi:hypothetical protein